jgi:beta-phosphoglucomutase-like phosphatase (HAD superfamily)
MVFEDAMAGIMSANRAGAYKIVGVASMINKEDMSRIDGVDEVIEDYINAINLLE